MRKSAPFALASSGGFTLIEVLVAAAGVAVVSLGMVTVMSVFLRSNKTISQLNDFESMSSQINQILSVSSSCATAFQTAAGTPLIINSPAHSAAWVAGTELSVPQFASGSVVISKDAPYVTGTGLRILGLKLTSRTDVTAVDASQTRATYDFVLRGQPEISTGTSEGAIGTRLRTRHWLVMLTTNNASNQVVSCSVPMSVTGSTSTIQTSGAIVNCVAGTTMSFYSLTSYGGGTPTCSRVDTTGLQLTGGTGTCTGLCTKD